MKSFLLTFFFITSALVVQAQYFQFSQYNFTPQRITPTAPASTNYAAMGFIYRNQGTASDIKMNSNLLSLSYPIINKKTGVRWSGLGVTLMDDRSGGIYNVQEASLSYAVNVFVNEFQSFSLGFRGLYQQRKVNLDGLYTGSQFVSDRGFDETISNGEDVGTLRNDFFTFSTGLSWQHVDREGIRLAYWSVSLFDFNKPVESFLESDSPLNSTWVAAGGFRAFREGNMSMFPEVLYTRNSSNNVLNVGMVTRCDVQGIPNQEPFHVNVITKYVVGRSGIVGLQFENDNFSLGFSYDVLLHKENVANVGAFEIGLELRRLVNPQPRGKVTKKNTPVTTKAPAKKPAAQTSKQPAPATPVPAKVQKKTMAETLAHKRDSVMAGAKAGKITHEPFEIEKVTLHFNFEFNSSDLDESSTQYLDELTAALKENAHLKVKLEGHTDNVGSANFNQRLSVFRANAIKEYLVSRGVDAARIETSGKGMSEPLNDNKTAENRAKNRRVELTILYQE